VKADELLLASIAVPNPKWEKLRRKHLKEHNRCAACDTRRNLEAHHIRPTQWYKELTLDPSNLITLCTKPANHHLSEGHLMDFKSYNENVVADCAWMLKRQKHRPIWRRF
jgi:hypothetical protein